MYTMRMERRALPLVLKGRGAGDNPPNRFVPIYYEPDIDAPIDEQPAPYTQFFRDSSRTIIVTNDSPDVGFTHSVNPYRGCEHGCAYCYARPTHEYFGLSAGLDFETKIFVKQDAPELLRRELMKPTWGRHVLAFSGVTDCFQPIERSLRLTRRCLEVCAEFRNPVGIVTKNHLVARDKDFLADLAKEKAAKVMVSVTTLDADLARALEPRASHPKARLAAIRELHDARVPVGVMVAPVIVGLTDHEIPVILEAVAGAGAQYAGYTMLRLPGAVAPVFENWLNLHYPDRVNKVLGRIRDLRDGKLNDSRFGVRMRGEGIWADAVNKLFKLTRKRLNLEREPELSTAAFRRPGPVQGTLFSE